MNNNKTILMVANVDWIFIAHRLPIAKEAIRRGYKVIVAANDSGESHKITKHGLDFIHIPMSRSGVNPIAEFFLLCKMFFLYRRINPDLVYQVTLKPVIYGSLIARLLGLSTVNAISGLGYNFTAGRRGFVQKQMIRLMKLAFCKKNNALIFENKDDLSELKFLNVIDKKNDVSIVKGVGVDLKKFAYVPPVSKDKIRILLATRMLWDKGVKEFIEAAKLLQGTYKDQVEFRLCGKIDIGNPEAVPESYLNNEKLKGYLEWVGYKENIAEEFANSDIVVLPSYREGMPTVLIEASAIGRPLITTTAIGCRECVKEAWNGYKVPIMEVNKLAEAIENLILNKNKRVEMGLNSRSVAEKEYDQREVVKKHIDICEAKMNA